MNGIKGAFLERTVGRRVPEETAEKIFTRVEGFSIYGFPKSHAAPFASLS